MNKLYPLLFKNNLHKIVWGGRRLKPMKGITPDSEPIGESWEISAISGDESVVENGPLKGMSLNQLISEFGADFLGKKEMAENGLDFPLLIKFIDAQQNLSIQVHPNDEISRERHGKKGKTEMWYIIDAEEGACLYSGFSKNITKEEYVQKVKDGTITDVLAKHEVHPGDVFFLPAGRVHAIGAGVLLAEVQQSSDVTYRIFDYNRKGLDGKPRELHTDLAVDVVDRKVHAEYRSYYTPVENDAVNVVNCQYFTTNVLELNSKAHRNLLDKQSFVIYMCLEGACTLRMCDADGGTSLSDGQTEHVVELFAGHSCLVPASVANLDLVSFSSNGRTRLLEVYCN